MDRTPRSTRQLRLSDVWSSFSLYCRVVQSTKYRGAADRIVAFSPAIAEIRQIWELVKAEIVPEIPTA